MKNLSLSILLLLLIVGCGDKTEVITQGSENNGDIRSLIKTADSIREAYSSGRILSLSSERDRNSFDNSLSDARNALILFANQTNDKLAVEVGYRALKEREQVFLSRNDNALIDSFYQSLAERVSATADRLGMHLGDLDWRLYVNYFSNSTPVPFAVRSSSSNWSTGISLDESYIRVQGPRNKAWLITPELDLRNIKNPSFRITHQTRADKNDRQGDAFNRELINQKVFKAYVSTNYKDGQDPESAEWTEVSLGQMPSSTDFHTLDSAKVNLENFRSKNTSIAFVFDADTRVVGSHYISWQISRFELFGNGTQPTITPRSGTLFEHLFTTSTTDPYQQARLSVDSPEWTPFVLGGSYRIVKMRSNGKNAETWLLSPKYVFTNQQDLKFTVKETFLNPSLENMEILISKNYQGGDPTLADWQPLEREPLGTVTPGNRITVTSGPFDLSDNQNSSAVIGFRYTAKAELNNEWDLEAVTFIGKGSRVGSQNYNLDFMTPGDTTPDDAPAFKEFIFQNGDEGFTNEKPDATAADWTLKTRNGQQYFEVSGHQGSKIGQTKLISPEINREGKKLSLQIKQAVNFYPIEQQDKKLIRVYLQYNDQEQEIVFEQRPAGNNWTVIDSEKLDLELPAEVEKFKIVLEYNGIDGIFPNWNVHSLVLFAEDL